MLMVPCIKATGRWTSNTESAKKPGLTVQLIKVSTVLAKSTAKDSLHGLKNLNIKVLSLTIIFMVQVTISGPMEGPTLVNGTRTKCTVMVFSNGLTVESTKVSMCTTKRKVMESSAGQMAGSTRVRGSTGNSTVWVGTSHQMASHRKANGRTVSALVG